MNTEIKNTILTTDKDAQYDESAKRLLGQKSILAHILVKTVDEFAGMDPKDVVSYIEGEPFINTVPIETGLTNTVIKNDESRVVGLNSENPELHEGMIRFDIIFYVRMRDGLSQMKNKGLLNHPTWAQVMAARNRKTLVVCRECHVAIHNGTINKPLS